MNGQTVRLTTDEIISLTAKALKVSGTSEANARPVAEATAAAEAAGMPSHGLLYVPIYCEHVQCRKVDGAAKLTLEQVRPALLVADAAAGFAHPAIALSFESLIPLARRTASRHWPCAIPKIADCSATTPMRSRPVVSSGSALPTRRPRSHRSAGKSRSSAPTRSPFPVPDGQGDWCCRSTRVRALWPRARS